MSCLLAEAVGADDLAGLVDSMLDVSATPVFAQFNASPPPSPRILLEAPDASPREAPAAIPEERDREEAASPAGAAVPALDGTGAGPAGAPAAERSVAAWASPLSLDFDDDLGLPELERPSKVEASGRERSASMMFGQGGTPGGGIGATGSVSDDVLRDVNWDAFQCMGAQVLQNFIFSTIDDAIVGNTMLSTAYSDRHPAPDQNSSPRNLRSASTGQSPGQHASPSPPRG